MIGDKTLPTHDKKKLQPDWKPKLLTLERWRWLKNLLSQSRFRSRFRIAGKEREYYLRKGHDTIMRHARDFVTKRLAPDGIENDGHQTPLRGHPVFLAQHATATCCRRCLEKWHGVEPGRTMTEKEIKYTLEVIMVWITEQVPPGAKTTGKSPSTSKKTAVKKKAATKRNKTASKTKPKRKTAVKKPVKKTAAKKTSVKKTGAKNTTTKKQPAVKKTPVKKAAEKKTAAKKELVKKEIAPRIQADDDGQMQFFFE